jgi:hypothetical protein
MCAVTLVLRCYLLLNHHTPEVDQKLAEAQARLKVAQAALHLAEVTWRRNQAIDPFCVFGF